MTTPLEVEEITGKPVIGIIPTFGEPVRTYGGPLLTDSRKTGDEAVAGFKSSLDAEAILTLAPRRLAAHYAPPSCSPALAVP